MAANIMATGGKAVEQGLLSHCLTTGSMAERLGLGADVSAPLQQVFTRWDGKGVPGEIGGEEIALPMRLFHLADTVEVFHGERGAGAAVDVARAVAASTSIRGSSISSAASPRRYSAIPPPSLTATR